MKKFLGFYTAAALLALTGCASFEDVKNQADAGNSDMQYKAAIMLLEGDGTTVDRQAAEKYLMQAFRAKNTSAACHIIKDIFRTKQKDQAELLLEAYDILFAHKGNAEIEVLEILACYPENVMAYITYLDSNGYQQSALIVKQHALANMGKCPLRSRYIRRYTQKIKSYKTAFEKAEEKRIAEEKQLAEKRKKEMRIAEEKRKAEEKRLAEKRKKEMRIAEEKRKVEEAKHKEEAVKFPLKDKKIHTPVKIYKNLYSGMSRRKEMRIAEEKRKVEEAKHKEEAVKFPLKDKKIHTPVKIYKNLYSGMSRRYVYKEMIKEKDFDKVTLLWEDSFLKKIPKDSYSFISECGGESSECKIYLDSAKRPKATSYAYINSTDLKSYYRAGKGKFLSIDNDYNSQLFLIGVKFDIQETKNVKVQTYIDKFKKDYPDLKQQGSIYPDKNNTKNTEKINAQITEAYQKLNTLKNKLLPNNINKLTQKEIKSIQQEIFDIQKDLIYKTQALSIQTSTSKQPELKLYNDNVSISFVKHSYDPAITITVTDVKLLDYRKNLDKEFDKIVKEYDKKTKEKQEKELLNF